MIYSINSSAMKSQLLPSSRLFIASDELRPRAVAAVTTRPALIQP